MRCDPKEYAKVILGKFFIKQVGYGPREREYARINSLLAVQEILDLDIPGSFNEEEYRSYIKWWTEVKHELESYEPFSS